MQKWRERQRNNRKRKTKKSELKPGNEINKSKSEALKVRKKEQVKYQLKKIFVPEKFKKLKTTEIRQK